MQRDFHLPDNWCCEAKESLEYLDSLLWSYLHVWNTRGIAWMAKNMSFNMLEKYRRFLTDWPEADREEKINKKIIKGICMWERISLHCAQCIVSHIFNEHIKCNLQAHPTLEFMWVQWELSTFVLQQFMWNMTMSEKEKTNNKAACALSIKNSLKLNRIPNRLKGRERERTRGG